MHVIDDADPVVNLHVATFYPFVLNGLFPVFSRRNRNPCRRYDDKRAVIVFLDLDFLGRGETGICKTDSTSLELCWQHLSSRVDTASIRNRVNSATLVLTMEQVQRLGIPEE
jgi:hypothetical protein